MSTWSWDAAELESEETSPHLDGLFSLTETVKVTRALDVPIGWVSFETTRGDRVERALLLRYAPHHIVQYIDPIKLWNVGISASSLITLDVHLWEEA